MRPRFGEVWQEPDVVIQLKAGRRLAGRMVGMQLLIACVLGLAWWLGKGPREAAAAISAATAVALGTALMAWRALGELRDVGGSFWQWVVGLLLKWIVVLGSLLIIVIKCRLPPAAALSGLVAAYAVNWLAFRMQVS